MCEWSNRVFLELRCLSIIIFIIYFYGSNIMFVMLLNSEKGRTMAVQHNVTHSKELEHTTLCDTLRFFFFSLLDGDQRHYRRVVREHRAKLRRARNKINSDQKKKKDKNRRRSNHGIGSRANRPSLEDLENQVVRLSQDYQPLVQQSMSSSTSSSSSPSPSPVFTTQQQQQQQQQQQGPPMRRRSSRRYGSSNQNQSVFLSFNKPFPVLVPPRYVMAEALGFDEEAVAAATAIQVRT